MRILIEMESLVPAFIVLTTVIQVLPGAQFGPYLALVDDWNFFGLEYLWRLDHVASFKVEATIGQVLFKKILAHQAFIIYVAAWFLLQRA